MERCWLLFAIALAASSSQGRAAAQQAADAPAGASAADSQPAIPATAAATPPAYAVGPKGEKLIRRPEPPADAPKKLKFRQIAAEISEGQVLGSDASFDIARLPATFLTSIEKGGLCTGTLIGPRVLLTAAHCVDAQTRNQSGIWITRGGRIALADGSSERKISCAMAPTYLTDEPVPGSVRNANDYALCELAAPLKIVAEPVSLEPEAVAAGQKLLIAGYGCTEAQLTDDMITGDTRASGTLHVGTNRVRQGGPDGWIDLKGRIGTEDAIICPGDSGGAAFANATLEPKGSDAGWRVVAVNSAVGPADDLDGKDYLSYLSPLADPDFRTFLTSWVAQRPRARKICGIDGAELAPDCRR